MDKNLSKLLDVAYAFDEKLAAVMEAMVELEDVYDELEDLLSKNARKYPGIDEYINEPLGYVNEMITSSQDADMPVSTEIEDYIKDRGLR